MNITSKFLIISVAGVYKLGINLSSHGFNDLDHRKIRAVWRIVAYPHERSFF